MLFNKESLASLSSSSPTQASACGPLERCLPIGARDFAAVRKAVGRSLEMRVIEHGGRPHDALEFETHNGLVLCLFLRTGRAAYTEELGLPAEGLVVAMLSLAAFLKIERECSPHFTSQALTTPQADYRAIRFLTKQGLDVVFATREHGLDLSEHQSPVARK